MRLRGKEQIYKDQKQERRPNHAAEEKKIIKNFAFHEKEFGFYFENRSHLAAL